MRVSDMNSDQLLSEYLAASDDYLSLSKGPLWHGYIFSPEYKAVKSRLNEVIEELAKRRKAKTKKLINKNPGNLRYEQKRRDINY